MSNLKIIQARLKSITSIQKITKSMKMVSTAKYGRAEKLLRIVKPFGQGTRMFYNRVNLEDEEKEDNAMDKLVVAITSDKGLCGAVHSQVNKRVLRDVRSESNKEKNIKIVCVGEKCRSALQFSIPEKLVLSVSELGRKAPTFLDASNIAQQTRKIDFSKGKIVFNIFNSIASYTTSEMPLYNYSAIIASPKLDVYEYNAEDLHSFMEFSQTSLIYYSLVENSCSEQSARMTAMENASKNAGEMIDSLKIEFNQTRQSVITQELTEIISGAAALR